MVFISGIIFIFLTVAGVRKMVFEAIPDCIKFGIAAGIGLFIAFIGLKDAGIVASHRETFVTLGDISRTPTLLALFGLFLTAGLMAREVKGAILIGLLATGALGLPLGVVKFEGVMSTAPSIAPTFLKLDIIGALKPEYIVPIFTLLFIGMFDAIGTLIGVGEQAGLMKSGDLPRIDRALISDAAGTSIGALFGTSNVTSYIESASGVSAGGRTGLSNMVCGGLFLLALFFSPLARMFGAGWIDQAAGLHLNPVTAPALIIVGSLMMHNITKINWQRAEEAIPAFLTIAAMPFTFSISNGLALGFISYPVIKCISGKTREVHWLVYLLALIFILRYIFLS